MEGECRCENDRDEFIGVVRIPRSVVDEEEDAETQERKLLQESADPLVHLSLTVTQVRSERSRVLEIEICVTDHSSLRYTTSC